MDVKQILAHRLSRCIEVRVVLIVVLMIFVSPRVTITCLGMDDLFQRRSVQLLARVFLELSICICPAVETQLARVIIDHSRQIEMI